MRKSSILALLLVGCVGCSASKKPDSPPPDAAGEPCGDTTCKAPEQCIDVHGRQPGPPMKECWIPCAVHPCPVGMVCDKIYDGPGEVCVEPPG
ncbi:hypothetical protein [Nannocystis pusilla]|uniref:Lipoprotein n=1 Tax=Nannocystis pusilla TaxID=889268 RepID=A0ABS7TR90_9BACT|nr:hypothetical protein [Nannocystis pusilla]MBZ5710696.1 hypothetical protein [Nannocystis pusilla]